VFQLLPCSRCQRTCSIRQEVSPLALLKCPNCGNQFRLGELFDALYEPWQVVEDPQGPIPTGSLGFANPTPPSDARYDAALGGLSAANAGTSNSNESVNATPSDSYPISDFDLEVIDDGSPLGVIDEQLSSADRSLDLDHLSLVEETTDDVKAVAKSLPTEGVSNPSVAAWPTFKSPSQEEHKRSRRPELSGIWSTLQVVLGGAAAIPVTLILLWYGLGKDVAGAGPAVARYVPWIVPKKFHGYAAQQAPQSGLARPARGPRPEKGESGFRQFDDVLPSDVSPTDKSNGSKLHSGETNVVESNLESNIVDSNGHENSIASEQAQAGSAEASEALQSETRASSPEGNKPNASIERDVPMANVFAALSSAKKKIATWDEPFSSEEKKLSASEDDMKKKRIVALLDDLAGIGEQLASGPAEGGAVKLLKNDLRDIGRSIVGNADLEKWFNLAVMAQFNGLPRSTKGRVFLCKVGQLEETESSWHIKPSDDPLSRLTLPTIAVSKRLAMQMQTGERLFLLGSMTREHEANDKLESEAASDNAPDKTDEEIELSQQSSTQHAPQAELFQASFSHSL
jgi:hypothetical protein